MDKPVDPNFDQMHAKMRDMTLEIVAHIRKQLKEMNGDVAGCTALTITDIDTAMERAQMVGMLGIALVELAKREDV